MLAQEVASLLGSAEVGTFDPYGPDGDIYVGLLPADPIECIAVIPSGGFQSPSSTDVDRPTIQVLVRKASPIDAYETAMKIYDVLNGLHQTYLPGGTFCIICVPLSLPFGLGQSENGMYLYTTNFAFDIQTLNRRNK
jgi:hypothetical protein